MTRVSMAIMGTLAEFIGVVVSFNASTGALASAFGMATLTIGMLWMALDSIVARAEDER